MLNSGEADSPTQPSLFRRARPSGPGVGEPLPRRFGPSIVAGVAGLAARDRGRYHDQPEAADASLAAGERSHARLLRHTDRTRGTRPDPTLLNHFDRPVRVSKAPVLVASARSNLPNGLVATLCTISVNPDRCA
jgi:hypothetical protein